MTTMVLEAGIQGDAVEEDLYIGDGDFMEGEEEEINIVSHGEGLDEETIKFDQIIGALSDILLDPEFEDVREEFCRENCKHFEDTGENKLIYMDIFSKYTELIETAIDSRLKASVEGFDMQRFLVMLNERKDELMSDVFDLLLSFGDFEAFREVMLAYKQELTGTTPGLQIHCRALHIHCEEQEDGEERPDLDMSLTISPVGHRTAAATH